jgi:hypothetical protein
MNSSDDLAKRLARLLEHVPGVRVESNRLELDPPPGGLPMQVQWSPEAITVVLCRTEGHGTMTAWHHEWILGDGEDDAGSIAEAVDLVAAVVFGHARVRLHARGTVAVGWDIEFLAGEGWSRHASSRAGRWRSLLRRRSVEILLNQFRVPEGIELGRTGRLPFAPWVGMLASEPSSDTASEQAGNTMPLDVDGVLDLHPFSPKEVAPLVRAYIDACLEQGITQLRIIHGKGIGHLRRTVHALLRKHPDVVDFRLGGHGEGSWGATIVDLRPPDRVDRG